MIPRLPQPGMTARGFARGGSYDRLAALVTPTARVLDLACGDGDLLERLRASPRPRANGQAALAAAGTDRGANVHSASLGARLVVGVDGALDELRLGTGALVCADAHALPFADASFDVVTCHLAFMLFAEPPRVVAELARVLAPGGRFLAVLGGGPTAAGGDALAWFAERLAAAPAVRDRRATTEAGWGELFAGWRLAPWERWELELSGGLDDVCATLAASYEPFDRAALAGELRAAFPADPIPCRAVVWLAAAQM